MSETYSIATRCANCGTLAQLDVPRGVSAAEHLVREECSTCGCAELKRGASGATTQTGTSTPITTLNSTVNWRARAVAHASAIVDAFARPAAEVGMNDTERARLREAQDTIATDMATEPRYGGMCALLPDGTLGLLDASTAASSS